MTPTVIYRNSKFALAEMPEEPTRTPLLDVGFHEDLERDYQEAYALAISQAIDFDEDGQRIISIEILSELDVRPGSVNPVFKDGDSWPMLTPNAEKAE
jgi:hypothetical protein